MFCKYSISRVAKLCDFGINDLDDLTGHYSYGQDGMVKSW